MSRYISAEVGEDLGAKFVRLGGVQWLRRALADAAEPDGDERPVRGVSPEERQQIARVCAPAKTVARLHRVPVQAVYRFRKEYGQSKPSPLPRVSNAPH